MPPANTLHRGLLAFSALLITALGLMFIADINKEHIQYISLFYPGSDKLAHFVTHMVLTSLLYWALFNTWKSLSPILALALAAMASACLGLVDEMQQFFVRGREFDLLDIAANLCGTITITLFITAHTTRRLAWLILLPLSSFAAMLAHSYTHVDYYSQGLHHIRHKDYAAAEKSFLLAIERGNRRAGVYNELAAIELEFLSTDPSVPLRYTTLAVQEKPNIAAYLATHGWALYRNNRYPEALEYLRKAYSRKPDMDNIHYFLGATYHALGQDTQASTHLRQQLTFTNIELLAANSRRLLTEIEASAE